MATGRSLTGYIIAYLVAGVSSQLFLLTMTGRVLKQNGVRGIWSASIKGVSTAFPGIWDYVWTTNINSTVRMLSRELDLVVVAAFAGPADVGIFKIAKQLAQVATRLFDPLYQAVYPELSRLWAQKDHSGFIRMMKRSSFFAGAGGIAGLIVFLFSGRWLIEIVLGPEYGAAYPVASIYLVALVIALLGFTLQPAMLAVGRPRISVKVQILATSAYFIAMMFLSSSLGIIGASLAYVFYYLVWVLGMTLYLAPVLRAARQGKQVGLSGKNLEIK
jgi:O-antigen/teichoic acid export membrane protein